MAHERPHRWGLRVFAAAVALAASTSVAGPAGGEASTVEYKGVIGSADGAPIPDLRANEVTFRKVDGVVTGTIRFDSDSGFSVLGEPPSDLCIKVDSTFGSAEVTTSDPDADGVRHLDGTIQLTVTIIEGKCASSTAGRTSVLPSKLTGSVTDDEVYGSFDVSGVALGYRARAVSLTTTTTTATTGDGETPPASNPELEDVLSPEVLDLPELVDIVERSGCGRRCPAIGAAADFADELGRRFPQIFGIDASPEHRTILRGLLAAELLSRLPDRVGNAVFPTVRRLRPVINRLAADGLDDEEARTAMLSLIRLAAGLDIEALR